MDQLPDCCRIVQERYRDRVDQHIEHSFPCSCGLNLHIGRFVNNMWISPDGAPFAAAQDEHCNFCHSIHGIKEDNDAMCRNIQNAAR